MENNNYIDNSSHHSIKNVVRRIVYVIFGLLGSVLSIFMLSLFKKVLSHLPRLVDYGFLGGIGELSTSLLILCMPVYAIIWFYFAKVQKKMNWVVVLFMLFSIVMYVIGLYLGAGFFTP